MMLAAHPDKPVNGRKEDAHCFAQFVTGERNAAKQYVEEKKKVFYITNESVINSLSLRFTRRAGVRQKKNRNVYEVDVRGGYKRGRRESTIVPFAGVLPTLQRSTTFVNNIAGTVTNMIKISPRGPRQTYLPRTGLPRTTSRFILFYPSPPSSVSH